MERMMLRNVATPGGNGNGNCNNTITLHIVRVKRLLTSGLIRTGRSGVSVGAGDSDLELASPRGSRK